MNRKRVRLGIRWGTLFMLYAALIGLLEAIELRVSPLVYGAGFCLMMLFYFYKQIRYLQDEADTQDRARKTRVGAKEVSDN